MHIMKLECLGKLPFGTYAEMERSGVNLNDIDTTDCDNSLTSLQVRLCTWLQNNNEKTRNQEFHTEVSMILIIILTVKS